MTKDVLLAKQTWVKHNNTLVFLHSYLQFARGLLNRAVSSSKFAELALEISS
jgi:hypothetical protein